MEDLDAELPPKHNKTYPAIVFLSFLDGHYIHIMFKYNDGGRKTTV